MLGLNVRAIATGSILISLMTPLMTPLMTATAFAQGRRTIPALRTEQSQLSESTSSTEDKSLSFELLGRNLLYSLTLDIPMTAQTSFGLAGTYYGTSNTYAKNTITLITPYFTAYSGQRHRLFGTAGAIIGYATSEVRQTNYSYSSGSMTESEGPTDRFSGFGLIPQIGGGYEFRSEGGFIFRTSLYLNYIGLAGSTTAAFLPWLGLTLGKTL